MEKLSKSLAVLTAAAVVLCLAGRAEAVPITYTIFGTGSGSLGGAEFDDRSVTVTTTADTSTVFAVSPPTSPFNGHGNFVGPITISVDGFAPATLLAGGFAFSNQDATPDPGVGIAGFFPTAEIMATIAPEFLGYDLSTAIGPITGSGVIRLDAFFATTGGDFNLQSIGMTTFEATIASEVPLPTALPLFATGLAGFGWLARRRKKQTA
jgi:hypothetical protein